MMAKSVLKTELLKLELTLDTVEASAKFVSAYETYAADAETNGLTLKAKGLAAGKAAMEGVLNATPGSLSDPGEGLTRIPNSVVAFWAAVAAGLATSFAGATAIVPPPHATFSKDFVVLMTANTASSASKANATSSLATLMHANAIVGGTATIDSTVYPIL